MSELINDLMSLEMFEDFLAWDVLLYGVLALVLFIIGKLVFDLLTPYKLNDELTEKDNKAVAVSFASYLTALGIIIWAVVRQETDNYLVPDLISTALWGGIGIVLLQIARVINDKLILRKFDNTKELVTDRNVGTACAEAGSYIGSAFIIGAVLTGEAESFVSGITEALIFFFIGQLFLFLFSLIYQVYTRFDLHKEIERDNVSAGLAFGLSLIALSLFLAEFITVSSSLAGFAAWFVFGVSALFVIRIVMDKLILPGSPVDHEIEKDQNWGAALIEGCTAIMIALIISAAF